MSKVIYLQDIVEAFDAYGEDSHSYLNIKTGEVSTLSSEEIDAIEDEDSIEDYPEWQHELIDKARDILELKSHEWVELPDKFDIHEYSIMENFSRSYQDEKISNELLNSIRGSGAFRYFRDTLDRLSISDEWYSYRKSAFEEIAKEWLDKNGIKFESRKSHL